MNPVPQNRIFVVGRVIGNLGDGSGYRRSRRCTSGLRRDRNLERVRYFFDMFARERSLEACTCLGDYRDQIFSVSPSLLPSPSYAPPSSTAQLTSYCAPIPMTSTTSLLSSPSYAPPSNTAQLNSTRTPIPMTSALQHRPAIPGPVSPSVEQKLQAKMI